MSPVRLSLIVSLMCAFILSSAAQQRRRPEGAPPAASTPAASSANPASASPTAAEPAANEQKSAGTTPATSSVTQREAPEEKPVVTHHEITVNGKTLRYSASTGLMPLHDNAGKLEAHIFYMAYTLDNPPQGRPRPLTFSFNGGPGSASVWLHMGAIGPKRVRMQNEGWLPAPPYSLEDNQNTWLDQTDLVFIDPVGTGYSRAISADVGKKFFGIRGDIESVGEFIRLYLGRAQRWDSPLFMVGESYGTFRAAGLAGYLIEHGIAFNGVMLISTIMDLNPQGDLEPELMLPSYTATAWYHKKLAADLQPDLQRAVRESEDFALGEYATGLAKGDRLTAQERDAVLTKLARYTGLSKQFLDNANLRVPLGQFLKELLRDQKRTLGRLDSRFEGWDRSASTGAPEFDPSMSAIRPPYTALFNQYVRNDLGYKSDLEYYILGGGITGPWTGEGTSRETEEALRSAFAKNPFMKLFVAFGYYDMATPYFAAEYELDHMGLDPAVRKNVTRNFYEAGHMMYIRTESLARLRGDIRKFYEGALRAGGSE